MLQLMRKALQRLVSLEWHPLGPRFYLFGVRVHEWHLGLGLLALAALLAATDLLDRGLGLYLLVAVGIWAVAKDWRDIGHTQRDTAAWRLGLHRRPRPLAPRGVAWLPPLAAFAAFVLAVVNIISTLTPDIGWRGHLLRSSAPFRVVPVFHALALPAAAALLVSTLYLARRRVRAWQLAFSLLIALGFINLLKGLDFEEASLSFALAALLWWGRGSFDARPRPLRTQAAVLAALGLVLGALALSTLAVAVAAPAQTPFWTVLRELGDLLLWQHGPLPFKDEFARLPLAIGLLSLCGLLGGAWLLFRPLRPPPELPDAESRALAERLVKAHGSDTLAYFKLRRDKHYLFAADGRAFLGYRVENGVLLCSGDPVGEEESIPGLLREALAFAGRYGLAFAVLGAAFKTRALYEQAGLKSIYVGDEAILELDSFSLQGRAIRKVRQSCSRLEKGGYSVSLHDYSSLTETDLVELEAVSSAWLKGEDEHGFSMAMDSLRGEHQRESAVVVARNSDGQVGGFLHFVPSYGRAAYSLSFMRRRLDSPNGLTEYLVVSAAQLFKERGTEELSLNFAAFSRFFREPQGFAERLLAKAVRAGDRFFQIESLYRFNAKFFPRWEPRYLIYESYLGLPRLSLAVLWAEGQLPRAQPRQREQDSH